MTTETKIICDGCGKIKGDVNRWWEVRQDSAGILLIAPAEIKALSGDDDLCGEQCVLARVQKFLAEVK